MLCTCNQIYKEQLQPSTPKIHSALTNLHTPLLQLSTLYGAGHFQLLDPADTNCISATNLHLLQALTVNILFKANPPEAALFDNISTNATVLRASTRAFTWPLTSIRYQRAVSLGSWVMVACCACITRNKLLDESHIAGYYGEHWPAYLSHEMEPAGTKVYRVW
jgi:hypothetical protein